MNQKEFEETVEWIKSLPITGCITGSCLIDCDKTDWEEMPDIDIFCYSVGALADAVSMLIHKYNYQFGIAEHPEIAQQEEWKYRNTLERGIWKVGLSTIKLTKDGININLTVHKGQRKALDVISNFDMTIICRAYDIPTKHMMDYSEVWAEEYENITDPSVSILSSTYVTPNPHKLSDDYDMFTAQKWLRQWDRVIKYWNRGFNTIPVAKFYSNIIQQVLDKGNIFTSEASQEVFEENTKDFKDIKELIDNWITEKEQEMIGD